MVLGREKSLQIEVQEDHFNVKEEVIGKGESCADSITLLIFYLLWLQHILALSAWIYFIGSIIMTQSVTTDICLYA